MFDVLGLFSSNEAIIMAHKATKPKSSNTPNAGTSHTCTARANSSGTPCTRLFFSLVMIYIDGLPRTWLVLHSRQPDPTNFVQTCDKTSFCAALVYTKSRNEGPSIIELDYGRHCSCAKLSLCSFLNIQHATLVPFENLHTYTTVYIYEIVERSSI